MYSPVPNGEQPEDGEESAGDSVDVDYADDSEGSDDDLEEIEEGEVEAQAPSRIERRTKQREDPEAAPSKTLVSSTRNPKRDRAATSGSTEKAAKQPKPDAPKPRKALPRIKIAVPVAST
jgi:hypothetical protein